MSRPRLGSRRRLKIRRRRERQEAAKQNKKQAQAAADPAQASTAEADTEAATNASALNARDTTGETETHRCKHRHLPDRRYYYREEKFNHRFVALDRRLNERVNERLDVNIAKGRAAMDADYRFHNNVLHRTKERLARKEQEIERTLRLGLRSMEQEVKRLKWKVDEIQQENQTLRDEIERERRYTRRMVQELYESSDAQETDRSD
ncbi:uncharacterized protein FMAN_11242 [Fusarium mangiferae]|uniref:Uncharacterized protein n=1 Tax=Fusarium mangiferae TaxID=192010 RepID=A0A1L7TEH7_FUSMA|nr:uncharacterized protein FMAN_11242 [Fusarium mangiferae]CVK96974.1 uncharacterized protein FMAN_11242 [Fusarium mangiferae]